MKPAQILVCGTNYGRIYLDAIRLGGPSYRLAGILGRGSLRSQQTAREYGVPLYCCVEDLNMDLDLACAAMGASGSQSVLSLLARGIHILCEHPQKPSSLQPALTAAASRNLCFHINGHFAGLEAAAAFIHQCRRHSDTGLPSFFHVMATDRSLYAALDILARLLDSFAPFEFHVTSRLPPFIIVQGLLGGVPITLHVQRGENGRPLPDASPAYLIDHRIAVGFPSGTLTLLSMNGPVIWNGNVNRLADPAEPLFTVIHESRALTAELLYQQRVAANLAAIDAAVRDIREHVTPPEQTPGHLLEVSCAWETLGSML